MARTEQSIKQRRAWSRKHARTKQKPYPGYFYVLNCEPFVRIGRTNNFEERLRVYNVHCPLDLTIINLKYSEESNFLERQARDILTKYRHKGLDWYINVPQNIIDILRNL